jgi:hypothetical protein
MMTKLGAVGVTLATPLTCVPNCGCSNEALHKPWEHSPFDRLLKQQRQPAADDVFHVSVVQRWKLDAAYRPAALLFVTDKNIDVLTAEP